MLEDACDSCITLKEHIATVETEVDKANDHSDHTALASCCCDGVENQERRTTNQERRTKNVALCFPPFDRLATQD